MRNNNLLAILLSVLLVSLSGCSDLEVRPAKDGELNIYVYVVEGQALECITLRYRLSCNWEKYNKLKKAS